MQRKWKEVKIEQGTRNLVGQPRGLQPSVAVLDAAKSALSTCIVAAFL
jgi:hypothetical protein